MKSIPERLKAYLESNPLDTGDPDCTTVPDQLYWDYAESHESDPLEIQDGFRELKTFLESLPLPDNNAVFNLCCRLCVDYERKAFLDGLHYGAELTLELSVE